METFNIKDYKSQFLWPNRVVPSAWTSHLPFAFFIIELLTPKTFVELGVHTGNSFFAFCQAVKHLNLKTACHGIDIFKGDKHAGYYDESIFINVNNYLSENYSDFATLMRMIFDEGLNYFPDGSIDLLHIDGLHTYEAVKHDFECWLPKMGTKGVMIFHDTQIKKEDFGVWKLWDEVSSKYPSYEFYHGYGLGILAIGSSGSEIFLSFLNEIKKNKFEENLFSILGDRIQKNDLINLKENELERTKKELTGQLQQKGNELSEKAELVKEKERELQQIKEELLGQLNQKETELINKDTLINQKEKDFQQIKAELSNRLQEAEVELSEKAELVKEKKRQLQQIKEELQGQLNQKEEELINKDKLFNQKENNFQQIKDELSNQLKKGEVELSEKAELVKEKERELQQIKKELQGQLNQKEEELINKDKLFNQKEESLQQHIAILHKEIYNLRNSWSWRVTKPARLFLMIIIKIIYNIKYIFMICFSLFKKVTKKIIVLAIKYYNGFKNLISKVILLLLNKNEKIKKVDKIVEYDNKGIKKFFKIKKVAFLIGTLEGESKKYRVFNIIEGLQNIGIECNTFYEINLDLIDRLLDSDLLILFRAAISDNIKNIIARFHEKKIPIVFDVDDLVFEPDSIHYVDGIKDFTREQLGIYKDGVRRYRETMKLCNFCTATTEFIVKRIGKLGKKSFIIRNTINKEEYEASKLACKNIKKDKNQITIGYFSGSNTHDKDFLEASNAFFSIMAKYPKVHLFIMGELQIDKRLLNKFKGRIIRKKFAPYSKMSRYLAQMDIIIVPLELNNPYTAGKSELKIFDAAMVNVPVIASSTETFSKCITDGHNGFLASNTQEWIKKLSLLIVNKELRSKMGLNAKKDFFKMFFIGNEIDNIINVYQKIIDIFNNNNNIEVDIKNLNIAWIIPEPFVGSGGHRNIFRAVKKLSEFGHKVNMYFTANIDIKKIHKIVNDHFFDLSHVEFIKYNGSLKNHDICFATHWSTVYPLMDNKDKIKYLFYFVQDFEPMFAPMGSEYILAENTYKMGLTHITSGPWPTKILKEKYNAEAYPFLFPLDKTVYNTKPLRTKENKNIIFFARPEMPRRCYELGIQMLTYVKQKMPSVEIILWGSNNIHSKNVPFECTNLGLLPTLKDLNKLYRNADIGIVFSTTNPSLVPYEMMASGLAVADIKLEYSLINYGSQKNIFLLDPSPKSAASEIILALNDDKLRQEKAMNGLRFVDENFYDEDKMGKRIESIIIDKISKSC